MKARMKTLLALLLLAPLLSACVDNETDRSCRGPDLGLDGVWFGAMEDDLGSLFTLEWQVCGSRIIRHRLSGADYGLTGSLAREAPGVYRARLSDGSEARLLTDPARRHAVMVSDFFDFAVLERGARSLPRYRFGDLDGAWSGRQVRQSGDLLTLLESHASCGSGLCSTLDADGYSTLMDLFRLEHDFGLFLGDYTASSGGRGIAGAMLSPDLRFLGSYSCPYGYADPWQCRFGVYLRD
jgi:hypothetical protein